MSWCLWDQPPTSDQILVTQPPYSSSTGGSRRYARHWQAVLNYQPMSTPATEDVRDRPAFQRQPCAQSTPKSPTSCCSTMNPRVVDILCRAALARLAGPCAESTCALKAQGHRCASPEAGRSPQHGLHVGAYLALEVCETRLPAVKSRSRHQAGSCKRGSQQHCAHRVPKNSYSLHGQESLSWLIMRVYVTMYVRGGAVKSGLKP